MLYGGSEDFKEKMYGGEFVHRKSKRVVICRSKMERRDKFEGVCG